MERDTIRKILSLGIGLSIGFMIWSSGIIRMIAGTGFLMLVCIAYYNALLVEQELIDKEEGNIKEF
ncbi:MAG: hypothetical protein KGV46_02675 [Pasteurella sp.]|nr:hypothetical protein [Pasteurella sp.]